MRQGRWMLWALIGVLGAVIIALIIVNRTGEGDSALSWREACAAGVSVDPCPEDNPKPPSEGDLGSDPGGTLGPFGEQIPDEWVSVVELDDGVYASVEWRGATLAECEFPEGYSLEAAEVDVRATVANGDAPKPPVEGRKCTRYA